jgi:iron complex transport system substrate-binding protein
MRLHLAFLFLILATSAWVRADGPARRVVSLSPNLTELVFALDVGDRLVGRSTACDAPAEAAAVPLAGDFGRPNLERLQELHPDVVLVTDLERPGLVVRLRALGIEVMELPCEDWASMMEAARRISVAVGEPEKGVAWTTDMESRRAHLAEQVRVHWADRIRPLVYLEVWGDPLTTPGRKSFLHDLIELAGGRNLGAALDESYAHVSAEWILAERPDVIVLAYMIPQAGPGLGRIAQRPGWSNLPALKRGRVCTAIPPDLLLRPGPRWIEGAEQLAEYLQGE